MRPHFLRLFLLLAPLAAPDNLPAQSCANVPTGLVSWWSFDGNANDLTGANNGSLVGPVSFVSAKVGQGLRPAPGGYVLVPSSTSLNQREFSIAGWIRIDGITVSNGNILWKGDNSGYNIVSPFALGVCGTSPSQCPLSIGGRAGQIYLLLGDGRTYQAALSATVVTPGRFYFVAATVDSTDIKLYVDGRLESQTRRTLSPYFNSFPLSFGELPGSSLSFYFNGVIDELDLYSRALAPTEVQSIFAADSAGKCRTAPPPPQPHFTSDGVGSAAAMTPNLPIAPGQIISIFGSELTEPCTFGSASSPCPQAFSFPLPLQLGTTRVTINGLASPLLLATPTQINLLVPWEVAGDRAAIVVQRGQASSLPVTMPVSSQVLSLFTVLSTGSGPGSIYHADGRVVSRIAPIAPNEVLLLFGTGFGPVSPPVPTGAASAVSPLSWTTTIPGVYFDGAEARVLYSGLMPGASGVYQMNVIAPPFLPRNYPVVAVQSKSSTANDVTAGGTGLLDITPSTLRVAADAIVKIRGVNFPSRARLRLSGEDLPGSLTRGGWDELTVTVPSRLLLRPGSLDVRLVDPDAAQEEPSNRLQIIVSP